MLSLVLFREFHFFYSSKLLRDCEEKMAMKKLPLTLCMERGPKEGQEFDGTHLKRVTIGRTRTNNYSIKDPTISQKHAIIEWKVHHWTLVDVGSSNGTAVNGTALEANEPVQIKMVMSSDSGKPSGFVCKLRMIWRKMMIQRGRGDC